MGFISFMNKTHFFLLFLSICLTSCSSNKDNSKENTPAPINTIAVIIDDQLWNGEVGDSIRNKFASPVIGLPQEEPKFTINQYATKLFEGYSTTSRNLLIIKKENKNNFEIRRNEFATPQNSFHISGKTINDILEILQTNTPRIIQVMKSQEIIQNQALFTDSLLNIKKIQKKFKINLLIPSKYKYVMRRKSFIWLKSEITSGNTSLLIYQLPWKNNTVFSVKDVISTRDSIGNLYIHGSDRGTRMITEEEYAPYFSQTVLDGNTTFETKGTWQMENDYMSGPFINYYILDTANKRIMVLEGFCYAPSKPKRDLMFELEAIIRSIRFNKKKK